MSSLYATLRKMTNDFTVLRLCLEKLEVIRPTDYQAVVIKVFWKCVANRPSSHWKAAEARPDWHRYMKIARLLQTEYWLEPAGSHGAQGLDDYHFAVFSTRRSLCCQLERHRRAKSTDFTLFALVFGSAQLKTHKYLRPKAIHDADILEEFSKDYMYLSYVRYINSVSVPKSFA